jgi:hypothetical protein
LEKTSEKKAIEVQALFGIQRIRILAGRKTGEGDLSKNEAFSVT